MTIDNKEVLYILTSLWLLPTFLLTSIPGDLDALEVYSVSDEWTRLRSAERKQQLRVFMGKSSTNLTPEHSVKLFGLDHRISMISRSI